jgi:hypothetical protein
MEAKVLTDYERGFLEAAIDFEGCIGLYKKRRDTAKGFSWIVTVFVGNTNKEILAKIKNMCGGEGTITRHSIPLRGTREYYTYRLPVDTCKLILPQLHLTIKEEQRLLMIDALDYLEQQRFWSHRSDFDEYLEQISIRIKELNSGGRVSPNKKGKV